MNKGMYVYAPHVKLFTKSFCVHWNSFFFNHLPLSHATKMCFFRSLNNDNFILSLVAVELYSIVESTPTPCPDTIQQRHV